MINEFLRWPGGLLRDELLSQQKTSETVASIDAVYVATKLHDITFHKTVIGFKCYIVHNQWRVIPSGYNAVHNQWHVVLSGYNTVYNQCHIVPSGYNVLHNQWHVVPSGYNAVHKQRHVVPSGYNAVHKQRHVMPSGYNAVHKQRQVVPSGYNTVHKQRQVVPSGYSAVHNQWQVVPSGYNTATVNYNIYMLWQSELSALSQFPRMRFKNPVVCDLVFQIVSPPPNLFIKALHVA